MQHDDMIWGCISQGFCSFKVKTREDRGRQGAKQVVLCSNPYNATGKCARNVCPLANSQYATVVEFDNKLFLYMKTVERAHSPKKLWEKVELPRNFRKALELVDEHLQWWDRKVILRCKQRLLRLKQVLIRKRRLALRTGAKLVTIKKKEERQLSGREKRAERAAKIETNVQRELLARLKKGYYPVEEDEEELNKMLDEEMDEEQRKELAALEREEEAEKALEPFVEYSDSDEEEDEESEESEPEPGQKRAHREVGESGKRRRVVVELEHERALQNKFRQSIDEW
eukprot:Hpha_TRINITY_DN15476_c2_g4::TRINITY_DN15476_c2_g4_i1::g.175750::m.175750/K14831/MAK16; protein MAK16